MDLAERMTSGYAALRDDAAQLDLSRRGKIRVTGEDRVRLLHAMTTNNIQKLQPGQGCYTFFLNSQGRILGDANVFVFDDSILLDTEPETRQKLFEHLDRYIIADDVTIEDQTESLHTIAIEGPKAAETLGEPLPEEPYSTTMRDGTIVAKVDSTGAGGYFLIGPNPQVPDIVTATPEEARIVRIENGRPRYGEEITEKYLVQETDQMQAVNFAKGCYLGQEIVERVRSRAQIHRVLRRLELDKPEDAPPNTEIMSSVFSPALGKTVALAYVRTSNLTPHSPPVQT